MLSTLKTLAAAAVVATLPALASAAPLLFNEGAANTTLIEQNNTYSYAETAITGAGSRTFNISATPPGMLELNTEFTTLEFTGNFTGLAVELTDDNGTRAAAQTGSTANTRAFDLSTVFNAANGFDQTLMVSWDDVVTSGTSAQAGILIQATPAAVPVPAAGLLLVTALGGAAALRRRKKA